MNITSATIREQGRDSNYTPIHARVAMNPLFTDSEAAASPFFFVFCLICILPSPAVCVTTKMSNCNVGVCGLSTDQLDAGYM